MTTHDDEQDEQKDAAEEYLAGWKRAQADYANLQRETDRFKTEFAKYAAAQTLEKLLPVFDSFEKAAAAPPEPGADAGQWIAGIGHIRTQLTAALKELGLESVGEEGEPFDPARHEAVGTEQREGSPPDAVLRVVEPGWALHGTMLKPARVIVSA